MAARRVLLAVGLVSCASASTSECNAEIPAAERSLLQMRASAATEGVTSQVAKMQNLAQELVKNQRPLTDDEKATVKTLEDTVVSPVLSDTQNEHNNAIQSLNDIKQTLDGCDVTLGARVTAVNGLYSGIEKRRTDLNTCRDVQGQLLQANQTAGDALSGFLSSAASDTPVCTSAATVDDLSGLVSSNQEWYAGKGKEYKSLRKAAQDAKAAFLKKKAECDQQEQDLREAECAWKQAVQSGKDEYATCRKDTLASYDQALKDVTAASVSRKHIWAAIKHLDCYLQVLMADQDDMKGLLDQCKADKPNVDHLNIVEPTLAPVNDGQLAAMGDTSTVCNGSTGL